MASKPTTNRTHKSFRKGPGSIKQETASLGSFSTYTYEGEDIPVERKVSRTTMLILDYKQFKAARKIQTMVRGWMSRIRYRRRRCAAIIIQREWRRYSAQRKFYRLLEQKVQEAIEAHHWNSIVRIQAYWRGFLVREHIHDQYRMKHSQRMAAQDLMNCIAFKLHYLLRTYQIPGIYSLRNSHVLSKVEKILISISFKQDNKRSFLSRVQREGEFNESRRNFKESQFATRIPYAGPNFSGICDPKCQKVFKEPNIDARMHQILRKYEAEEIKQKQADQKCPSEKESAAVTKRTPQPLDFCRDIIKSMNRWKVFSPNKLDLRRDIFNNPENLASFLTEIESIHNFMNEKSSCYCKRDPRSCDPCAK